MQVLFLWDAQGQEDASLAMNWLTDASSDESARTEALTMAQSAWSHRAVTDAALERLAPQWPVHRQPGVDRCVLRLAMWELTHQSTPPKVVIDEAIELAKTYSTELSPAFVNAVLDAILREHEALTRE